MTEDPGFPFGECVVDRQGVEPAHGYVRPVFPMVPPSEPCTIVGERRFVRLEEPLEGALIAEWISLQFGRKVDGVCEDEGEQGDGPGVDPQGEGAGIEPVPVGRHEEVDIGHFGHGVVGGQEYLEGRMWVHDDGVRVKPATYHQLSSPRRADSGHTNKTHFNRSFSGLASSATRIDKRYAGLLQAPRGR